MPPNFDFVDWWTKESHRTKGGVPPVVVSKMENPNWSKLELESPKTPGFAGEKDKGKNAKQLTWVLLLKAHRAAGCVVWMALGLWTLLQAIKKRLILKQGVPPPSDKPGKGKLYKFITAFLTFAVSMLIFEVVAHVMGWHFSRPHLHLPTSFSLQGLLHSIYQTWIFIRLKYIAPPLQFLADGCIVLFLIQSADRVILCLGCVYIKMRNVKPIPKDATLDSEDPEQPESGYPMVLIQIPMCNEREVYEQSISAVCQIDWPRDRLLIQVLDDSDDQDTRMLIKAEVQRWNMKGINILYRHRVVRTGYKAGNLKSAMNCEYVQDYEFVTIFDADFQPKSDFLKKTIPHFKDQPELALVQARWTFVNRDENLLTRLQNVNLCFHFEVEQQVNGVFLNFFGFNGTAGVWRIKALEESGGWLERTTVEDMDIAVRAHLQGWKFIFLNDVECLCELPESYEAYRKQQHRWHSGPMQLFRLCLPDIITCKLPWFKKANLIFLFFLLRKLILPFYSFSLFCVILPLTMFVPEAQLPTWVVCYIPALMSFLNVFPAPKSFPFLVPYLLFENTMSVTKFNAMISGLFQLSSSFEWVVTKKSGRASETDLAGLLEEEEKAIPTIRHNRGTSESGLDVLAKIKEQQPQQPAAPKKKTNRLYRKELALAFLLLTAAARSLLSAQGVHFYFLLFQGISFLVVGLDLIGEQVS